MANDKNIKVKISLDGVQEFRSQLKAVSQATDTLGKDFQNLGSAVTDSAKAFLAIGVAIAGVATAIVGLTAKNAEAAESFQNVAERSGNSVETVQTFAKIAGDAGLNSEAAGKGLARFTKNMDDFKDPTSAASKELDRLAPGLRQSLVAAGSADDRFAILRNTLAATKDETTALNIANLAGGKAFQELLPVLQQTDAEYLKQQDRLKQLGVILSDVQNKQLAEFDDAFDEAGNAIDGVGKQLSVVFAPALTQASNAFTEFVIKNRGQLIEFANLITTNLVSVVKGFFTLLSTGPEAQGVDERARALYNGFIALRDAIVGAFNTVQPILEAFYATLNLIAGVVGMGSGAQLGLTLAFLQFTGVFRVALALITVGVSSFRLLAASVGLVGPALALLGANFAKAGAVIVATTNTIRTTFLAAVVAMQLSGVTLASTLAVLRTAFLAVWAAVTGPIGLVIAAVALLAAGIAFVIDKTIGWEKALDIVVNVFKSLGSIALEALKAVGSAVLATVNFIGTAFLKIPQFVASTIVSAISGLLQGIGSLIQPVISTVLTALGTMFNNIVTGISNAIKAAVDALKAQVFGVFDAIKNAFNTVINGIKAAIDSVKNVVSSVIGGGSKTQTSTSAPTVIRRAGGGEVSGPGTSTSDSILARLSTGEFVVKAAAVRKYGLGFMHAINNGVAGIKGFATGGLVEAASSALGSLSGPALSPAMAGGIGTQQSSSGRPLNLIMPNGEVVRAVTSESTAKKLEKDLRRSDISKTGKMPRWY